MAACVSPALSIVPCSGQVCGGGSSKGSVDPRLTAVCNRCDNRTVATHGALARYPRPLVGGGIELPKVIEIVQRRREGQSAKKPEAAIDAGPGDLFNPSGGNICGRGRAFGAVDAGPDVEFPGDSAAAPRLLVCAGCLSHRMQGGDGGTERNSKQRLQPQTTTHAVFLTAEMFWARLLPSLKSPVDCD